MQGESEDRKVDRCAQFQEKQATRNRVQIIRFCSAEMDSRRSGDPLPNRNILLTHTHQENSLFTAKVQNWAEEGFVQTEHNCTTT